MKYKKHPSLIKITLITTKGELLHIPFTKIRHKFYKKQLILDFNNNSFWNQERKPDIDTKLKKFQKKILI